MCTVTGEQLEQHVGKWNVAALASDLHELVQPAQQVIDALHTLLKQNVDVAAAWWQVTGTVFPPDLVAHLKLRTRLKPVLQQPHACSRELAKWYANGQALDARGSAGYSHIATRMRAFTALLTGTELKGFRPAASVIDTQVSLLPYFAYDWCLAACVSASLHVPPMRDESGPLAPLVGSPSARPTHAGAQLLSVSADNMLPLEGGVSRYGVLCTGPDGTACILGVSAASGQVESVQFDVLPEEPPVWIVRYEREWVVGYATRVGPVHGPWTMPASLPFAGPVAKLGDVVVWKAGHRLSGYDLEEQSDVEHELLTKLLVDRADCLVAAQGKCVFTEGVALFDLPEEYTDVCAGVHRARNNFVDVFTTRGDWWRVHVPSLSATVVGVGVPCGYVVKDTCVY